MKAGQAGIGGREAGRVRNVWTLVGLLGLALPAGAQLMLYEAERFEGRTLALTARQPNLDRIGFGKGAASVVVLDDRWEVCEDIRFRDGCKVLRRGRYPTLESMALNERIASVRPVSAREQVDSTRYAPEAIGIYDARRRRNERLYEAPVHAVRAVMGPPEQRCWIESENAAPKRGNVNVPGVLAGALIGGILGHQIGGGSGRDIATVGGVIGGAAVGSRMGSLPPELGQTREVQRCVNVRANVPIDHYEVSYRFRGQNHQMQTLALPGSMVTVNHQGEPRQ